MSDFVDNANDSDLAGKYSQQKFVDLEKYYLKWEKKYKVSELQKRLERLEKVKDHDELVDWILIFMKKCQPDRLKDRDSIPEKNLIMDAYKDTTFKIFSHHDTLEYHRRLFIFGGRFKAEMMSSA